jgi:hypothetical protein
MSDTVGIINAAGALATKARESNTVVEVRIKHFGREILVTASPAGATIEAVEANTKSGEATEPIRAIPAAEWPAEGR